MIQGNIKYFKDYYLDIYSDCVNYMSEYDSVFRSISSLNIDIRNLVCAWLSDYDSEILGIGPEFTLRVELEGGLDGTTDNCHRDMMIESAYRDYILNRIDPHHIIDFETSDYNVTVQIKNKLLEYRNNLVQ